MLNVATVGGPMDPSEFNQRLRELSGEAICALAAALRDELETTEGEVAWWRATIAISAALKRQRRSREAGLAAHTASVALVDAAIRAGLLETARDDVTVVARAASEVARALVAETTSLLPTGTATAVLAPWESLVPTAA
jgi:hypothetical protein